MNRQFMLALAGAFILATAGAAAVPDEGDGRGPGGRVVVDERSNDPHARPAGTRYPDNGAAHFRSVLAAREAMRSGDCAAALPRLERAADAYPDNGDLWGLMGLCYKRTQDWHAAVGAFENALALGVTVWEIGLNPNDIMIEIAGAHARAGEREAALGWLARGLEARFDEQPDLADRADFASLRDDPEFRALAGLSDPAVTGRDAQWRADIRLLQRQIRRLHADPYRYITADALDTWFEDLLNAVPRLDDADITAQLDLIVGRLGAGHDLFWPVAADRGALLPFAVKFYVFSDGIYIIDAADPDLVGARVEAFGDTPAEVALAAVVEAFPGDNAMEALWMAPRHLAQAHTLEALGVVDDADDVPLTLVLNGERHIVRPQRRAFTPMSPALVPPRDTEAPLYLTRWDENAWMADLPDIDALYIQYKRVMDSDGESFAAFTGRLHARLAERAPAHLILDLRHSPGGNGYLTPALVRELAGFRASAGPQSLFVIIGRNTFSASQNMITDLDRFADPVFVGEPSGSRPNALSESGNFRLPYSGLSGYLSSQYHQQSWPEDHRIWIAPDIPVALSSADFFAGRDPALGAIEAFLSHRQEPSR